MMSSQHLLIFFFLAVVATECANASFLRSLSGGGDDDRRDLQGPPGPAGPQLRTCEECVAADFPWCTFETPNGPDITTCFPTPPNDQAQFEGPGGAIDCVTTCP